MTLKKMLKHLNNRLQRSKKPTIAQKIQLHCQASLVTRDQLVLSPVCSSKKANWVKLAVLQLQWVRTNQNPITVNRRFNLTLFSFYNFKFDCSFFSPHQPKKKKKDKKKHKHKHKHKHNKDKLKEKKDPNVAKLQAIKDEAPETLSSADSSSNSQSPILEVV